MNILYFFYRCHRWETFQGQNVRPMGYLDARRKPEVGNSSGWKLHTSELRRLFEFGCAGLERLRQVRYKEEGEGTRDDYTTRPGNRRLSRRPFPRQEKPKGAEVEVDDPAFAADLSP